MVGPRAAASTGARSRRRALGAHGCIEFDHGIAVVRRERFECPRGYVAQRLAVPPELSP